MFKKFAGLIILLFIWVLAAGDLTELKYELEYNYWLNYFPTQKDKEYSWHNYTNLQSGVVGEFCESDSFWCTLCFNDQESRKRLYLEDSGYLWKLRRGFLGYRFEQKAGMGKNSQIMANLINHKYNRGNYLLDYSLGGICWQYSKRNYQQRIILGGNSFNDLIADYGIYYTSNGQKHEVKLLLMSRDSIYNRKMAALNYLGEIKKDKLDFRAGFSGQLLGEDMFDDDYFWAGVCFSEIIFYPVSWLQAGGNYRLRFRGDQWQEQLFSALISAEVAPHRINLIYMREEWQIDNSMDEFSVVYWWQTAKKIKCGFCGKCLIPLVGERYFEAGMQMVINK